MTTAVVKATTAPRATGSNANHRGEAAGSTRRGPPAQVADMELSSSLTIPYMYWYTRPPCRTSSGGLESRRGPPSPTRKPLVASPENSQERPRLRGSVSWKSQYLYPDFMSKLMSWPSAMGAAGRLDPVGASAMAPLVTRPSRKMPIGIRYHQAAGPGRPVTDGPWPPLPAS